MNFINDLKVVVDGYYDLIVTFLPLLGVGILSTAVLFIILQLLCKRLFRYLETNSDDPLLVNFLKRIVGMVKWIISVLFFLYIIGQGGLATAIFGAATISSVVIGFAFKDIAENFLAGVILAFNRPFRVKDIISTAGVEGVIESMSLRDTHIKTFDGKDVYVPNGQIIKNPLYNYTIDGFMRKNFVIGIDYASDIEQVRGIIQDSVSSVPGVLKEQKGPKTFIKSLGASTINIEVQYWMDTFDKSYSGSEVQSQAIKDVLANLENAGVLLPGDVIELKNYNTNTLKLSNEMTNKSA